MGAIYQTLYFSTLVMEAMHATYQNLYLSTLILEVMHAIDCMQSNLADHVL